MNAPVKPYSREDAEQLVGPPAHAVDVVAEVRVRVEEVGVRRNLGAHEGRRVVDQAHAERSTLESRLRPPTIRPTVPGELRPSCRRR